MRPLLIAAATIALSSCLSEDQSTCSSTFQCLVDVSTAGEIFDVGKDIDFKFELWTTESASIKLYDGEIRSIAIFSRFTEISGISNPLCVPGNSGSSARTPEQQGTGLSAGCKNDNVSWVPMGPDKHYVFQLPASSSQDNSGGIEIRFSDDLFFAFSDHAYIAFYVVPAPPTFFGSDEGRFGSEFVLEFQAFESAGRQQISIIKKPVRELARQFRQTQ